MEYQSHCNTLWLQGGALKKVLCNYCQNIFSKGCSGCFLQEQSSAFKIYCSTYHHV